VEYFKEVPEETQLVGYEVFTTYINVFESKSAIEMHEGGIVAGKYRVSGAFHCVTPSSSSALSQELSPPGDKQHLHSQQTHLFS
jgi:hypothetical protein